MTTPALLTSSSRKAIGARLAALRRQRGLTQTEIAEAIGLTQPTINRIEYGKSPLNAEAMPALAQVLSVDVTWLLGIPGAPVPVTDPAPAPLVIPRRIIEASKRPR